MRGEAGGTSGGALPVLDLYALARSSVSADDAKRHSTSDRAGGGEELSQGIAKTPKQILPGLADKEDAQVRARRRLELLNQPRRERGQLRLIGRRLLRERALPG